MARYIRDNILFQAYVHVDADFETVSDEDSEVRDYLSGYIDQRAKHFLDASVATELEIKDGSIRAYATVRGSLHMCLPSPVVDFETAINQLYWFTKRLSDAAVMEVTFMTHSYLSAIERTEARPGIIGRTKHIVDALLALRPDRSVAMEVRARRVQRLHTSCVRLLGAIADPTDVQLLRDEFSKLLARVPSKFSVVDDAAAYEAYQAHLKNFRNWLQAP